MVEPLDTSPRKQRHVPASCYKSKHLFFQFCFVDWFVFVILVDVEWYLLVVLIYISLVTNDIGYLLISLLAICKLSFRSSCSSLLPILMGFYICIVDVSTFYIIWAWTLCQIIYCKYCLFSLWVEPYRQPYLPRDCSVTLTDNILFFKRSIELSFWTLSLAIWNLD